MSKHQYDESAYEDRQDYSPEEIIEAIKGGEDEVYSGAILHGLSDLLNENLAKVKPIIDACSQRYKLFLLQVLSEAAHEEPRLDYSALGRAFLDDELEHIRVTAIEMLEWDESLGFMRQLVEIARNDPSSLVRGAALVALGRFILAGELGQISEAEIQIAQNCAYAIWQDRNQDNILRGKALEAVSQSSYEGVDAAIKEAYADDDNELRVSAVVAMGHSCDEKWDRIVLSELSSKNPEMRFRAAYAAGEIQIEEAIPDLVRAALVDDDEDMKKNAIWSLGEIGGKEAMRTLNLLLERAEEEEDEELYDFIEEALASASIASGDLMLMNFDDED